LEFIFRGECFFFFFEGKKKQTHHQLLTRETLAM
jgi:hypothetical protein